MSMPTPPKDVAVVVRQHNRDRTSLKSLDRRHAKLRKGDKAYLKTPSGTVEVDTKLLNDMHSALNRQTSSISRAYGKAYAYQKKKKKSKKRTNINGGLKIPVRVQRPMLDFVEQSGDQDLVRVARVLLGNSLGSRQLLSSILRRYIKRNNLVDKARVNTTNVFGQRNGQYFAADSLMRNLFGPYFAKKQADVNETLRELRVVDGDMKPQDLDRERNYFKREEGKENARPLRNFNDYYSSRTNPDGLKPNYNDYYHSFDLDNLMVTGTGSILASASVLPYNELKLTPAEAAMYGKLIEEAKARGGVNNYRALAVQAAEALGFVKGTDGFRNLETRGALDDELVAVDSL